MGLFLTGKSSVITRGGIHRAPKVSIEGRLPGFLNDLTNESKGTVLPRFFQETQVAEASISPLNTATGFL